MNGYIEICPEKDIRIFDRQGNIRWEWKAGKTIFIWGNRDGKAWNYFRNFVLKRDSKTCQECGSKNEIVVHHIEPVKINPNKIFDIDNLITLCKNCHRRKHRKKEKSDNHEKN